MPTDYSDWSKTDLISEVKKLTKRKKFGLVWDDNFEDLATELIENLPVVEQVASKGIRISNSEQDHLLIEGENLNTLYVLGYTHQSSIDLIYIDPPYNTGLKDFRYNDHWVRPDDSYKHSKWLSFISKRLQLARKLLRDDGAIFISIDNNEQAQLKLLGDEIFGESNFIGTLIWRKKEGGGQTDQYFVTEHEYILGWAKTPLYKWHDDVIEDDGTAFNKSDERGTYKLVKLAKWGNTARRIDRPKMHFSIDAPNGKKIFPIAPDGEEGRWRVGVKRMSTLIDEGLVEFVERNGSLIPYEKVYFSEGDTKTIKERSIIYDIAGTADGTNELTQIFGEKDIFQNPKPTALIQYLISYATHKEATVLDFFAGSGTTGHAVLKLNAEDGGSRKFILATDDIEEEKICTEVCYPRISKVLKGYSDKKGNKFEGLDGSLVYFKTKLVPSKPTDANKYFISKKAVGTLCIKESCYIPVKEDENVQIFRNKSKLLGIVFGETNIENFKAIIKKSSEPVSVYIFSLGGEDFSDEFSEFNGRIQTKSIPEGLLNAYRRSQRAVSLKK